MTSTPKKVLAVAAIAAALAVACVEKNPTVTGHRPETDAATLQSITVVAAPDDSDDDAADCRFCGETLSTDTARGTLCKHNAGPSVKLLNDLVDCVCYSKCIDACASYCSGSRIEDSCAPCILSNCVDLYAACQGDVRQ
jgi:hypothetical protein